MANRLTGYHSLLKNPKLFQQGKIKAFLRNPEEGFFCIRMQDYIMISPSFETLLNRTSDRTVNSETTVARAQALPSVAFATAL